MTSDLERLWSAPSVDPVQPRLLDALTGLDEHVLRLYRHAPTWVVGWYLRPHIAVLLKGNARCKPAHQMVHMAGIALWEREHGQAADSIGL